MTNTEKIKKDAKILPRTLPGFMELLPGDQILFNKILDEIREAYESYGFLPIDTPLIESANVILAKAGGETEKQIYRFTKGNTDMVMRFDLTVPLAKYVAANYNNLVFPFKRYQIGKVYRGERPQKGRFREFYQCDIDIINDGELSILNDAEIPSIIYTVFCRLGFDNFTIYINNRKILNGLLSYLGVKNSAPAIMQAIDKINKIGVGEVTKELSTIGISDQNIKAIIDLMLFDGTTDEKLLYLEQLKIDDSEFLLGTNELRNVVDSIRNLGVPDKNFKLDYRIARGLDYYTGTVYETFIEGLESMGSVCSGGRYDNLTEYYSDKKLPGVGISIGLTRLFYQLQQADALKISKKFIAKVLVITITEDISSCLEISVFLRKNGIPTELYTANKSIKQKFKYANRLNIPFVIIIGEDEINSKTFTLKDMETGEQKSLLSPDKVLEIVSEKF